MSRDRTVYCPVQRSATVSVYLIERSIVHASLCCLPFLYDLPHWRLACLPATAPVACRRRVKQLFHVRNLSHRLEQVACSSSSAAAQSKEPKLVPNLLLLGLEPQAYLLKAISSVRASELDQATLLLEHQAQDVHAYKV